MLWGVLSDTHDQKEKTLAAIEKLRGEGALVFFHCGDLNSLEMIELFSGMKTYFVRGNLDPPEPDFKKHIAAAGGIWLGAGALVNESGRAVAITHGHLKFWKKNLLEERPDFLFLGHSHKHSVSREGATCVVNPGALYRADPRTCALVDSGSSDIRFIRID